MATFRVGQRVRCVRKTPVVSIVPMSPGMRKIGETAVVVGTPSQPNAGFRYEFPDGVSIRMDRDGAIGMVASWQLEPIQPEANKVIEWSECLWQPPGVTA